ncbi:MAG: hypothetical protein NTZ44_04210 [Candidatus Nomurabacteria bacterium]|nr:hypothetical protein [Candidatus Nomurabacteria bacterium]
MDYQKENKICQNCNNEFPIFPEDFLFYQKIGVPAPTWCPFCRFIRKLTFINERSLYKRNCENCNESTISMYSTDTTIPVWCVKCFLSDALDARDYGREYDFSKTFFEQFKELKYLTPHRALDQNERNGEGCEYSNYCYTSKNVYLSFFTSASENIKYSRCHFKNNKNCVDCFTIEDNDRGYELVQSNKNYNSSFLVESSQCIESQFLYDCSNCVNCCLSSNLRNKSFVFKNQQLSREAYKIAVDELKLDTYSGQLNAKTLFKDIAQKAIHKHAHIKNSVNAVGDFIENSKNVYHCYSLAECENVRYSHSAIATTKDSYDLLFTGRLQESYESTVAGRGGSRLVFSLSCGGTSKDLFYCDSCRGCSDCFGCVSLSKKQYCILNKQYTKEEYFEMIEKIKNHLNEMIYVDSTGRRYPFGECFPTEISPFAYNESVAFEENHLSKDEVLSLGYRWKDMEAKAYASTISSDKLPESINEVNDDICNEVVGCPNNGDTATQCTSAYKITVDELAFYRQMNLPLPRYCPNCRYYQRRVWENPFKFFQRECMCNLSGHTHEGKCPNQFETTYPPDKPDVIYCEKCYQQEIY